MLFQKEILSLREFGEVDIETFPFGESADNSEFPFTCNEIVGVLKFVDLCMTGF